MTRDGAIAAAARHLASGRFADDLARRVAYRTVSQDPAAVPILLAYLADEMKPTLERLGFGARVVRADGAREPFLVASRHEAADLPTVLIYGHGDVVGGMDERWTAGRGPWRMVVEEDAFHGRGTADNKGQHGLDIAALAAVIATRGDRLGFNVKVLIEMGEEAGSPGLHRLRTAHRAELAADVLIASDGPRLARDTPTLFLGSRGALRIKLDVELRSGAHHSGNWGGLLSNPGTILASAIATLVDGRGRLLVDALKPPPLTPEIREALADVVVAPGRDEPELSADWGEPGLGAAERVYAWNTLEVLSLLAGDPAAPANAIPGRAEAVLQLRYVAGTPVETLGAALRQHLDARDFRAVAVSLEQSFAATRTPIDDPWVDWARASITRTLGAPPAVLPNIGGALPNDVFTEILGLPTLWIPHSYPGCQQHAPDEHLPVAIVEEGLRIMAGLFWDLGDAGPNRR
jgi:acetylornithine deacetylase/succinyl-diaminopimelate desuccinylase-like protein